MSWLKRKESRELQLYGKLPIAKDYLRIGCSQGVALELREWADRAFSGAVEGVAPKLASPMRFTVHGRSGSGVVGCVWPSSDAGGLRPFPCFALYEASRKSVAEEWRTGRVEFARAWRGVEAVWPRLQTFADGEELLSKLRGSTIEDIESAADENVRPAWNAWLARLWGANAAVGLEATIVALEALATADRNAPVRLPLARDIRFAPQVHGWWSLLAQLEIVRPDEPPSVFFPSDEAPIDGAPYALFVSDLPRDARWLAPTGESPLGPSDLARAEGDAGTLIQPALENEPPLADSLRGALLVHRTKR